MPTAESWRIGGRSVIGGNETARDAEHIYSAPNTYTVALTVTDDDGATDSIASTVHAILPPPPPPAPAPAQRPARRIFRQLVHRPDLQLQRLEQRPRWNRRQPPLGFR